MKTVVWMIRHGETEWNVEGRLQGARDSPLTERGRRQSEAARDAVQGLPLAAIYSSDLGRAEETARIVRAGRPLEIRLDPRLRELAYGQLEGMTYEEIARVHPELHAELMSRRQDFAAPGGERRPELTARVAAAVTDIARAHGGGQILVVTHGGALSAFFRWVVGVPPDVMAAFKAENGALNRFDFAAGAEGYGRFQLVTWGAVR